MGKEWHRYEMVLILNRIVSDYKNGQGCDAKTFETYASSKQNTSQWTQYVKIVAKSGGGGLTPILWASSSLARICSSRSSSYSDGWGRRSAGTGVKYQMNAHAHECLTQTNPHHLCGCVCVVVGMGVDVGVGVDPRGYFSG